MKSIFCTIIAGMFALACCLVLAGWGKPPSDDVSLKEIHTSIDALISIAKTPKEPPLQIGRFFMLKTDSGMKKIDTVTGQTYELRSAKSASTGLSYYGWAEIDQDLYGSMTKK